MRRIVLPATVVALLAVAACGGGEPAVTPAGEASTAPSSEASVRDAMPVSYPYGSTATWPDGVAVTVGAPVEFEPSESAFTAVEVPVSVRLEVTLANGSSEPVETVEALVVRATSGDREAESITDIDQGVSFPNSRVLPGKSLRWSAGFGRPGDDLVVTVSRGLGDPVTFQ